MTDIAVCNCLLEVVFQITTGKIPAAREQNTSTCTSLRNAQYLTPINTKLLLFTAITINRYGYLVNNTKNLIMMFIRGYQLHVSA